MEISDLAGLSKPAEKLIEIVSKAIGVLYEPRKIKAEAQAHADAMLVTTQAEIEADDLRRRAAARWVKQEVKKQENLESIMRESAALLEGVPSVAGEFDDDWLNRFILEAQEISDKRLHALWAKLLAGEFQSRGKFPRRLFAVLKDLEPREVEVINCNARKLLWVEDSDGTTSAFLHSHISEEWYLAGQRKRQVLAQDPVENRNLLQELGLIEREDFVFHFSVEGPLEPSGIHLSRDSAKRVFAGARNLVPAFIQPNFMRSEGPTVTLENVPQINVWVKSVIFDAWKLTRLGECMFELTGSELDPAHLNQIRKYLIRSGTVLQ